MVRIIVEDRGHWLTEAGATVDELLARFKTEHSVRFKTEPVFQETQMGRVLPGSEIPLDHHVYYLSVWTEAA